MAPVIVDVDVLLYALNPATTDRHRRVLGQLVTGQHDTANLVPDAHLVALAIEHGVAICSYDTDMARFPEATWISPRNN